MNGLAVVFHRDRRPVDRSAVRQMLDAIPHRTVDGAWVRLWPAAGVGLGFGKLTITPEEVDEQQPLISSRSGCVVIADARLDNRAELLQRLPQHHASSSTSDAELILLAYETWGVHSPKHLLGDFAFIVWDPREQHLVMARDTSGQRSLFYRDDGRTFVAASELHQLLQDPAIPIVPNDNRIRDFLVPVNVYRNSKEQDETFYRGLLTVPAGHVMVVTRTGTSRSRYWDMDPRRELRYRRDQDYAEHFRALFLQVVQDRLRSSSPIGATLSGGLDSSSIVSAAQEIYSSGRADNRGFGTFSVVYDDLDCDERPLIEATRAKYNLTATYVPRAEVAGLLRLQPRYFAEEPQANSPEAGFPLIRAVFDSGARLLLTGDVADAYVGGSRLVFDSQLRQGHFRQFWNDFRVFRRIADESLHRTVIRSCLGPLLPLGMQKQLNLTHVRRFLSQNWDRLVPTWMTDDLQDDLRQRHLAISIQMEQSRKFSNPAREDSFQMLYPPLVARDYLGWPVELSRPYADRRLHEFMLSIPPEQHFRPHPATDQFYAGSKRLVREGLRGILPDSIRTLTAKTGFGSVFAEDISRNWSTYQTVFARQGRSHLVERGYLDHARFWTRLQQLRDGARGGDFVYLIRVLGLETWLRGLSQARGELVSVPAPWRTQTSVSSTAISTADEVILATS